MFASLMMSRISNKNWILSAAKCNEKIPWLCEKHATGVFFVFHQQSGAEWERFAISMCSVRKRGIRIEQAQSLQGAMWYPVGGISIYQVALRLYLRVLSLGQQRYDMSVTSDTSPAGKNTLTTRRHLLACSVTSRQKPNKHN